MINKWKTVLGLLNINSEHMELVAEYAEQHSNSDNYWDLNHIGNEMVNTLPSSLRILKYLLDNGIEIELSKNPLKNYIFNDMNFNFDGVFSDEYYFSIAEKEFIKNFSNKEKIIIYKIIDRIIVDKNDGKVKMFTNIKI